MDESEAVLLANGDEAGQDRDDVAGERAEAEPRAQAPGSETAKRRRGLTADEVLEAALTIVDDEGIDALTMRHLGERLGVNPMTPYRHFATKDALLDTLADREATRFAMFEPSVTGNPTAALLAASRHVRSVLLEHPNLAALVASRPLSKTMAAEMLRGAVLVLRVVGFRDEEIGAVGSAMSLYTLGFVLHEVSESRYREIMGRDFQTELAELRDTLIDQPADTSIEERALSDRAEPDWRDRQFEFGLRALVAGLWANCGRADLSGPLGGEGLIS